MNQYKIAFALTHTELEHEVNALLAEGWELFGDLLIFTIHRTKLETIYIKEMVKYDKEN